MRRLYPVLLLLFSLVLAGCGGEPEPPPAPAYQPQEKKVRQIKVESVLSSFYKDTKLDRPLPDDPNAVISQKTAKRVINAAVYINSILDRCDDPDRLVNTVANTLASKIKEAEEKKLWSYIPPLCQAYKTLRPKDKLYDSYAKRAVANITRPRIAIRGFYHDYDSGQTTVIMKVFNQTTRETTEVKLRLGESGAGVRFERVIGKDEGAELTVVATGQLLKIVKGKKLQ